MNNNSLERTLSIIKPDAVERELETKIKKIFLDNKLNIVDSKKIQISKDEAEKFYKVHQTKPFSLWYAFYLLHLWNITTAFVSTPQVFWLLTLNCVMI